MKIQKIKNLKYSQSKNQEEAVWLGSIAKRNQLLFETDWTQLPDIKLTEESRNQWTLWRGLVRNLKRRNFKCIQDFVVELTKLESEKYNLDIVYSPITNITDVSSGKKYLHKLLVSFYNERMDNSFSPNLENKYQETLDIVSIYLSKCEDKKNIDEFNMTQLIEYIKAEPPIDIDIKLFPFFELTKKLKNFNINETIIYILDQKQKQFDFSLQEEYNLIHYEHRIDFCSEVDDILKTKREIEMNYGH